MAGNGACIFLYSGILEYSLEAIFSGKLHVMYMIFMQHARYVHKDNMLCGTYVYDIYIFNIIQSCS